jgi:hypothetical protein
MEARSQSSNGWSAPQLTKEEETEEIEGAIIEAVTEEDTEEDIEDTEEAEEIEEDTMTR